MTSQCPQEEALGRYHDGELEAEAAQQLESHLAICPLCAAYHNSLKRIDHLLLAPLAQGAGLLPSRSRRRGQRVLRFALAAACLTVLLLGLPLMLSAKAPPGGARRFTVASARGETFTVDTAGDVKLLSIEIDDTVADSGKKEE